MKYYPLLHWKASEQLALQYLEPEIKKSVVPIIEAARKEKLSTVLDIFIKSLHTYWGTEQEIILDLHSLPDLYPKDITEIFEKAAAAGVKLIPLISPSTSDKLIGASLTALAARKTISHIAFRATIKEPTKNSQRLHYILELLGLDSSAATLIVDLKDVSGSNTNQNVMNALSILQIFGTAFAHVVLLSGSVNQCSYDMAYNSSDIIPRNDFAIWKATVHLPNIPNIDYGDYSILPAIYQNDVYHKAPLIIYTMATHWLLLKGIKRPNSEQQLISMSKKLVSDMWWRVPECYGEKMIDKCSLGEWGPGSYRDWLTIEHNIHISFVVNQLNQLERARRKKKK